MSAAVASEVARTERLDYLAAQDEAHARERLSNQARALEAQDAARAEKGKTDRRTEHNRARFESL